MLPHKYRTMEGQPAGKDGAPGKYREIKIEKPELYDLEADIAETKNVAVDHADIVKRLLDYAAEARTELGDTLTKKTGKGTRPPGQLTPPKP
jgi:hypothetical protein